MHLDLTDRVVVVTGAARGIGRTLADRFAAEGCRVVALDLAFEPDFPLDHVVCNVADPESVRAAVDEVVARHGTIDVLVNNAGINVEGTIAELQWDAWRRCMDVNLGGTFLMSQAVAPVMQAAGRGGSSTPPRSPRSSRVSAALPTRRPRPRSSRSPRCWRRSSARGASPSTRTRRAWSRRR